MSRAACAALISGTVLLGPGTARAAPPQRLELAPRTPAILVVLVPRGLASRSSITAIFAAAEAEARRMTRLGLLSAERAGVDTARFDQCPAAERLSCWLEAATTAARDGGPAAEARYLIVVGARPLEEGDRLTPLLLDLGRARAEVARLGPGAERAGVEQLLAELVISAAPRSVGTSTAALRAAFRQLWSEAFAATLGADARPLGRLLIQGTEGGALLSVDGARLGLVSGAEVELSEVEPGRRRLALAAAGGETRAWEVQVLPGHTATTAVPRDPPRTPLRLGLALSGAVAVLSGAAVLGLAAAQAADPRATCLVRSAEARCPDAGGPTLGHDTAAAPSFDRQAVDPTSLSTAPLGAGLLAMGTAWGLGAWLSEEEQDLWLPLAGGVLLGVGTYAIGALRE